VRVPAAPGAYFLDLDECHSLRVSVPFPGRETGRVRTEET